MIGTRGMQSPRPTYWRRLAARLLPAMAALAVVFMGLLAPTTQAGEPRTDDSAHTQAAESTMPQAEDGGATSDTPAADDPAAADKTGVPEDSENKDAEDASALDPAAQGGEDGTAQPVLKSVPQPRNNTESVVTVKVGGDRLADYSVAPIPGVQLGLFGQSTDADPVNDTWAVCTSDADGDCSFVVPDTQTDSRGGCSTARGAGVNCGAQFWVKQISAPDGWTINSQLRTGGGTGEESQATQYAFRTAQLRGGTVYSSGEDFMAGTGSSTRNASGGVWQESRVNPSMPNQCGLDVAIVLDLSNSVAEQLPQLKQAADNLVDALTGTPSRMAAFSFSSLSPANRADQNYPELTAVSTAASAAAFKAQYAGWGVYGGTNWDHALHTVAQAAPSYDLVVMITDGSPTMYGPSSDGPRNYTRLHEVEEAIFSANELKAKGSRVLTFAVGAGLNDTSTARNLAAISGSVAYDGTNAKDADFYQLADYAAAGAALHEVILEQCQATLTVVKQIVPSENRGEDIAGAAPAGAGWQFTASTAAGGQPTTRTTTDDGTGAVNFPLEFSGQDATTVTVREQQQDGYALVTQGGANAVCTQRSAADPDGVPLNVVSDNSEPGNPGFSFDLSPGTSVSCIMYNQERTPAPWTLVKTSDPESGTQVEPGSTITYTLTATPGGDDQTSNPTNLTVTDDLSAVLNHATLDDTTITASTGTATLDGTTLTWEIPELDQTATLTYTVTINPDAYNTTVTNVATADGAEPCPEDNPDCRTTTHDTPEPAPVDPPPDPPEPKVLAFTGAQVGVVLPAVLLLLAAGVALRIYSRNRHTT